MEQSVIDRVTGWSGWTWKGMRGDPTSLSNAINSLSDLAWRWDDLSADLALIINARMFAHLEDLLLPMFENISSGTGTSKTVSSPSCLSKFGHSFLISIMKLRKKMEEKEKKKKKREDVREKEEDKRKLSPSFHGSETGWRKCKWEGSRGFGLFFSCCCCLR